MVAFLFFCTWYPMQIIYSIICFYICGCHRCIVYYQDLLCIHLRLSVVYSLRWFFHLSVINLNNRQHLIRIKGFQLWWRLNSLNEILALICFANFFYSRKWDHNTVVCTWNFGFREKPNLRNFRKTIVVQTPGLGRAKHQHGIV